MSNMEKPEERLQQALAAWSAASHKEPRAHAQERAHTALLASVSKPRASWTFFLQRGLLAAAVVAGSMLLLLPGSPSQPAKSPSSTATASIPSNEIALAASYIKQAPVSTHPQQLLASAAALLSMAQKELPPDHQAFIWKEWEATHQELVTTEHEVEQEGTSRATHSTDASPAPPPASTETQSPGAESDAGSESG